MTEKVDSRPGNRPDFVVIDAPTRRLVVETLRARAARLRCFFCAGLLVGGACPACDRP